MRTLGRRGRRASDGPLSREEELTRALDAAVAYLAARPRSQGEVAERLRQREFPAEVVSATLGRLLELGYVDDRAFAASLLEDRARFRPMGRLALRQDLRQRGVDKAVVDEALGGITHDAEVAAARQLVAKRTKGRSLDRLEAARVYAFLVRRGFEASTVREAMRSSFALDDEEAEP